jgi:hypothetical protein
MPFVGIVASVPVSGSYYSEGGTSDIDALKTSKSDIQFVLHREQSVIGVKTAVYDRNVCDRLCIVQ